MLENIFFYKNHKNQAKPFKPKWDAIFEKFVVSKASIYLWFSWDHANGNNSNIFPLYENTPKGIKIPKIFLHEKE